jgi:hypothetical protein
MRNNRKLRKDAMISREIIRYNNELYKRLHNEFAPVNKDDDYGKLKEKWRRWEELTRALKKSNPERAVWNINNLPSAIRNRLNAIKSDFLKINPNIKLKLDGDWVNNTWVDQNMLDIYNSQPRNLNNPVVEFISLRQELHKKTGVSKLSVYITNDNYDSKYDALIAKYSASADFYFMIPTGAYAKEI